ncbi:D-alanyl-D-alanine carboxypeptidase family protein [Tissierella sp. Yu-01]|uniref:D-alanyl-D-alanine carboxypeptidase family protein n=1 Tax=Tissierella sp. Yu-01 TaxID=3035694 RepID=UPI00240DFA0D|nr:D-alanyl-D-alanine carboxypeptidase family protein [Tissierella sp. Yu-01]WFA09707.1 D-alanyl-D-alanine carboxypeptidase [Tissierella sp. Yu-01]
MKKRYLSIFLVMIIILNPVVSFGELDITSKAVLLMDYGTGKTIFAINEHEKMPPASVTKIMTLLLAMEAIDSGKLNLDNKIPISDYAAGMGGTQVYLEPGETQRVEDLIKAVAIRSANDAAVALGEAISGTNEGFIKLMNERAKSLGMNDTNFTNASGLPADDHYTTAYDIALMSRELLKHTGIQKYLTTYMDDLLVGKEKDDTQVMVNTNRLVRDYDGTTGIKTGSTKAAGYCISASAKRGDLQLIAVILGGQTSAIRFNEAKKLLDYGFANYDSVTIGKKDDVIITVPIEKSNLTSIDLVLERDAIALLPKGNNGKIDKQINHNESIRSPIMKGDILGELIISVDNQEIDRINLISKNEVKSAGFLLQFKRTVQSFLTGK